MGQAAAPSLTENRELWYGANLVGLSTPFLASVDFNAAPRALCVHGTRESHPGLFRLLRPGISKAEAAEVFDHYMAFQFDLIPPGPGDPPAEVNRFVASYLRLLRAWGVDSNNAQGAVLKGWVESRFGLPPVFHKERLERYPSPAWIRYYEEKMSSRFHNNGINFQLDILYEFCQWSLRRFEPGMRHVKLWRGTYDCEKQVVSGNLRDDHCIMRLNNLVSFSLSPQRAEEFGDWILEVNVPTAKLLYFPGLLCEHVFNSEEEYLVIGGDYEVRAHRGYIDI